MIITPRVVLSTTQHVVLIFMNGFITTSNFLSSEAADPEMIATQDTSDDSNTIQDTNFSAWEMPELGSDEARSLELCLAFPKQSFVRFAMLTPE